MAGKATDGNGAEKRFKVIDCEIHLMEPLDLWERNLEEPYRSRTKVIPPQGGVVDHGGFRLEIGGQTWPRSNRGLSDVQKQSMRKLSTAPNLKAATEIGRAHV